MSYRQSSFSCYVIGGESLTIKCAELLLKHGCRLLGIISNNDLVKDWSIKHQLTYIDAGSDFGKILAKKKFDYLFSIVNPHIIPSYLLKVPRHGAINYHDALLPQYAGVHATSWAILNKEKQHGITWHVMTDVVDAGDILKQAVIPIAADETALSLNLKCYEAAINTFEILIHELATRTDTQVKQDLTWRSYYAFNQKPEGNGWINWHNTAQNIERLYRALKLGSYVNRLATLKLNIKDQIYLIDELKVAKNKSTLPPGSITKLTAQKLHVATQSHDIVITKVKTLDAKPCAIQTIIKQHALKQGVYLFSPSNKLRAEFQKVSAEIFKYEYFWLQQIKQAATTTLPFLSLEKREQCYQSICIQTFTLSPKLHKQLNKLFSKTDGLENILFAACLIYLYRINQQEIVTVALNYPELTEKVGKLHALVADFIPLNLQFSDTAHFEKILGLIARQFNICKQKQTFLKDVQARYSSLHDNNHSINIGFILKDPLQKHKNRKLPHPITFSINRDQIFIYGYKKALDKNLHAILNNISDHLLTLLEDIAKNPQKKITYLALLTEKEKQQILIEWNQTQTNYPKNKTVHQLFEEQVEKTPDNIAVVFADQKSTYRELNQKANQLAYYLQKQGAKPESFIALCTQEGLENILGILAILKVGSTYVPIDPDYPPERIKHIFLDSQAGLILTQKCFQKLFTKSLASNKKFVFIEEADYTAIQSQIIVKSKTTSSQSCALIYTSGSTGLPKGVKVLHKNIVKLVKNINYIDIESSDCIAQASNIAFDATHFEIWGALLNGAKLAVIPKNSLLSISNFTKIVKTNRISILWLTSSLFNQIYQQNAKILYSIDKLIIGGEKLDAKLVKQFISGRKTKPYVFLNGYGPTEGTTFSACYKIDNKVLSLPSIPIGKPISNTQCYVVDKFLQPMPVGSMGELLIGGAGITAGYLHQLEQTKQKFIPDLFTKNGLTKLYRTGDMVRWLPDGNLEYIGRTDDQIKLRGFRIELSEIEIALAKHPQILTAVVCVHLINERKQLEAFYTRKGQNHKTSLSVQSLESYLKSKLPDYMIPKVFVEVSDFPLTSNGKINKNKLIASAANAVNTQRTDIESENLSKVELKLIQSWRKTLKVANISIHDNFFALGGDSITAMSVVAEASKYGLQLAVQDIFKYPTIQKLAKQVKNKITKIIKTVQLEKPFALTPIQQWFFDQSFTKQTYFSQICLLTLNEIAEVNKLKYCLQHIVSKHDAFRLSFRKIHGKWQQSYSSKNIKLDNLVEVIDASRDASKTSAKNIDEYAYELQASFNLNKDLLVKAIVFTQCASNTTKLLIAIHHLIVDGVSWRILLDELQSLYKSKTVAHKKAFNKPIIQNSSFHSWVGVLSNYADSKNLMTQKNYWETIDKQSFAIPIDYPQMERLEEHSAILKMQLTVEETKLLLQKTHEMYGVKPHEVLIALLARTLASWANTNHVVFDLESHGRAEITKEFSFANAIGWFTSLFPVHLTVDIQASLWDAVINIKQQLQKIPDYGIGYGLLRYYKKANLIQKRQVAFNYWGQFDQWSAKEEFQFEDLRLVSHPKNKRTHLLNIDAVVKHQQLVFTWTYCQNAHHETTLQGLAQQYLDDLRALLLTFNDANVNVISEELDYSLTQLSIAQIKTYINDISHTQKIYPLAPLQKGLLFHAVYSLTSEAYMIQLVWKAVNEINLDVDGLQQAWQMLAERHDILRTQFLWEGLTEPLQIVKQSVSIPWNVYDWTIQTEQNMQAERLNLFLKADRQSGFNFKEAPLLRLTIIKLPENEFFVVATFHHILLDGWSLPLLLSELNSLYSHIKLTTPIKLPALKPYRDYIQWSQQQDLNVSEKFWRGYLKGFAAPTDLAITNHHMEQHFAEGAGEFATEYLALPKQFVKQLKQFCKQNYLTISTLFQGVWALLLNRYSQSEDVVFGITLAGRAHTLAGIEQAIGLFINTLPLRIKLEQALSVKRYLTELQINASQLIRYQHTPLTHIQAWSDVANGISLFNSILVFENYPAIDNNDGLLKFSEIEIIDPTHYPLSCVVVPKNIFTIKITYDKKLIQEAAVKRLSGHLETLLKEMVKFPEKSIYQLDLLTEAERQQILIDWNNTEVDYPGDKTIHQLFEEQVEKTPNNIAVVFENKTLTYRELNAKANQLAHYLIKHGVKPENLVAICVERSLEMIIGILGILKAGGAYVPIDPNYPTERVQYIVQNSRTLFFLTQSKLWSKYKHAAFNKNKIILIDQNDGYLNQPTENPAIGITSSNLIYVTYTSGSTGNPKGVLIQHNNVVNILTTINLKIPIKNEDTLLAVTTISFDISVLEIFLPLVTGIKCIIANYETAIDGKKLKKIIKRHHISILQATPITWQMLLEAGWEGSKSLKVLCGGEALSYKLAEQLLKKASNFWNLYGPTETTIWSVINHISSLDASIPTVPIGKPLANTKAYVLNKQLQPLPIGIIGELYIAGRGVARGYLDQKDLTKTKFVEDLFNSQFDSQLYKTGDLARWLPDGKLEFIARRDNQIKINGYRIELGEIQARLELHSIIKQAVIVCYEKFNSKQLVAYFIKKNEINLDGKYLREFLLESLPPYMVPNIFVEVNEFPLTTNGKIDIKKLPVPTENWQIRKDYARPRNKNEKKLAEIWANILGVKSIGINDNFFNLGGNSLLALSILSKIQECFSVSLSVRSLFERPTVAELINIIESAKHEKNVLSVLTDESLLLESCLIPLKSHGSKPPLFLIHPIGGTIFWYVSLVKHLDPDRPLYGIQDPGIELEKIPFTSIEEMANSYIKAIKKVQPCGPYLIGGASAGANISIEIARQLINCNDKVAFVGLFDGWVPFPDMLKREEFFKANMQRQFNSMLEKFVLKGIFRSETLIKLQWYRLQMYAKYQTPSINFSLTLFKAANTIEVYKSVEDKFNHWEYYTSKPINRYIVPGDHETIFQDPNVAILGKLLNECLEKTEFLEEKIEEFIE